MSKMSELDQAVQTAVETIVSKRFRNIFARLDDLEKSIRSTNTRITQIKCRLGEMNTKLPMTADEIYDRIEENVLRYPIFKTTDGRKVHNFLRFCVKSGILKDVSPQYKLIIDALHKYEEI